VSFGGFRFLSQKIWIDENFQTVIPIHGATWLPRNVSDVITTTTIIAPDSAVALLLLGRRYTP
jgi:hypothetical protein